MNVSASDTSTEVRTKLARRFCRVVAVIDDEIEVADDPNKFNEHFGALRKRFDQESIICHLHHYQQTHLPPDDEVNAPLVERAFEIAAAADLVVIDWHLGMTDDPSHALSVIRKLTLQAGIRFVLINTRIDPKEPARIIKEQFAATVDSSSASNPDLIRLRIGDNFFLSVRHKAGTSEDASALINEAQGWLSTSFPDHLHWAGLELAVRVREMLPKVVAAMPKGTNAALAHQLLFQRDEEIAEQITDVFLDELKLHFKTEPLATVSDKILFESLKAAMQQLAKDQTSLEAIHEELNPGWAKEALLADQKSTALQKRKTKSAPASPSECVTPPSATEQLETSPAPSTDTPTVTVLAAHEEELIKLRKVLPKMPDIWATPELPKLRIEKNRKKHFPAIADRPHASIAAAYLKSAFSAKEEAFASWASLKESSQLPFAGNEILFPGCVLQRITPNTEDPTWLLCITPACDCYWKKAKGYLFVIGTEQTPNTKSKMSQTQTWFRTHAIAWDAKALIVKPPTASGTNIIDGYKIQGAVRNQFATRTIQRVWSYQSRIGVDTSEYYRTLRDEQ